MNSMLETFSLKGMLFALTFILNVWMTEADEATGKVEESDVLDYLNNLNRLEQIDLDECHEKFYALSLKVITHNKGRMCSASINEVPGVLTLYYINLDTVGTEEGESLTVEIEMDDKVPRTQMSWLNGTDNYDCPKLGLPAAAEEYAKTDRKATIG